MFFNYFKTTFNEYGLCYTFNNYPQAMDSYLNRKPTNKSEFDFEERKDDFPFVPRFIMPDENTPCTSGIGEIRQVAGCGRKSGLRLIIDNHKMENLLQQGEQSDGYYVFITVPGVVSSTLPFPVDPRFEGEHNFYIHGIHVISVSIMNINIYTLQVIIQCVIYQMLRYTHQILILGIRRISDME